MPAFASAVTHGNVRVKPVMADKLCALLVSRAGTSSSLGPALLTKHVVPVALELLNTARSPELVASASQLLRFLHTRVRDALFRHADRLPVHTQERLRALL